MKKDTNRNLYHSILHKNEHHESEIPSITSIKINNWG